MKCQRYKIDKRKCVGNGNLNLIAYVKGFLICQKCWKNLKHPEHIYAFENLRKEHKGSGLRNISSTLDELGDLA